MEESRPPTRPVSRLLAESGVDLKRDGFPGMIHIINPNPRILRVWRGDCLQDNLGPRDTLSTPHSSDLTLSYEGKRRAKVAFRLDEVDGSEEEWIQEIGGDRSPPDPALAIVVEKPRRAGEDALDRPDRPAPRPR